MASGPSDQHDDFAVIELQEHAETANTGRPHIGVHQLLRRGEWVRSNGFEFLDYLDFVGRSALSNAFRASLDMRTAQMVTN